MAAPLWVPPDSARYALLPDKYAALIQALEQNTRASGLEVATNRGSVTFQKVTFLWTYNGADELLVTITANHSFEARLIGNEAIFGHLNELLKGLV
jgi:hypothetical protein